MSDATQDFLKRNDRERKRSMARHDQFFNEFNGEDHALNCFRVAVAELSEENEWQRIMDRTRALLNKIKN